MQTGIGYYGSISTGERTKTHIVGIGGPICGAKPSGVFRWCAHTGRRGVVERYVECRSCSKVAETKLYRHLVGES